MRWRRGSSTRNSPSRTKSYLDTPLNNPPEPAPEEVEVTDPTHPLFGRRFPVLSISRQRLSPPTVFVAYRDTMRLRIPVSSTSLESQPRTPGTKWTRAAIREFLSLVQEVAPPCHSPGRSGRGSRKP